MEADKFDSKFLSITRPQRIDTAVHHLQGLLRGVSIDNELNADEILELKNWCDSYKTLVNRHPFNEFIPKLNKALNDGIINPDEQDELLWLCQNLSSESIYYNEITNTIQILHGILHGIMADDHISLEEAKKLEDWINDNDSLKGTYPYDELESLLMKVLEDGVIDEGEQKELQQFFNEFFNVSFSKSVRKESKRVSQGLSKENTVSGICATCPEISFKEKVFSFTGRLTRGSRKDIVEKIESLDAKFVSKPSAKTNYLIVGGGGNPAWAFACYGRKIERVVELRKADCNIIIVHENDFWDAVEDFES